MLWDDGCPSPGAVTQGKFNMTTSLFNLDETGGKELPFYVAKPMRLQTETSTPIVLTAGRTLATGGVK